MPVLFWRWVSKVWEGNKSPGLYSREYDVDSIYSALCYIVRCLCSALLCSVFALCVVMPVGSIEFTIIPHFPLSFFVPLSFSLSILLPLSFPLPYFLLLSLHSKGLLVLKELGFEVETYIASEIDPDAVKVTRSYVFLPTPQPYHLGCEAPIYLCTGCTRAR